MKKLILAATLSLPAAATLAAPAASWAETGTGHSTAKRSGIALTSMATGALAGGPLGAMAGLIAAAWINDQVAAADQLDVTLSQLSEVEHQVDELNRELALADAETEQLAETAQQQWMTQLQQALLFSTADSELSPVAETHLLMLVSFLSENPGLDVRLDGHADPRGHADFNLSLSGDRAQQVADFLMAQGIGSERIAVHAQGETQSAAVDVNDYAQERVVKVELLDRHSNETFTQIY